VLLEIVQYHDVPFSLWNQVRAKGRYNPERLANLLRIGDWDLFVAFLIIDSCTEGKDRASLRWFLEETSGQRPCRFSPAEIL
jgi:hypothetical protein